MKRIEILDTGQERVLVMMYSVADLEMIQMADCFLANHSEYEDIDEFMVGRNVQLLPSTGDLILSIIGLVPSKLIDSILEER